MVANFDSHGKSSRVFVERDGIGPGDFKDPAFPVHVGVDSYDLNSIGRLASCNAF